MGEILFLSFDRDSLANHQRYSVRERGYYISRCVIPGNLLNTGTYVIGVSASIPNVAHLFFDPYAIQITVDVTGAVATQWAESRGGFLRPALDWNIECLQRHA